MTFSRGKGKGGGGGCSFYIKSKLKSETFDDKKVSKVKNVFLCPNNLNWEILTKHSFTFKRWDGSLKNLSFREGRGKAFAQNIRGNYLKKKGGGGLDSLQI